MNAFPVTGKQRPISQHVIPPSITSTCPVMKPESGESKKRIEPTNVIRCSKAAQRRTPDDLLRPLNLSATVEGLKNPG